MCNKCHLDDVNTLNLKITPMIVPPPAVHAHQVPIFVCAVDDMEATKVDLTLQQVMEELSYTLYCVVKALQFFFEYVDSTVH